MRKRIVLAAAALLAAASPAAAQSFDKAVFAAAKKVQPKVVEWRRDIHEHPELGNNEIRTSKLVADHLRKLGFEVRTVAKTGVVGVLKGGRPGGVVALRADMDALPVAEQTGLPFASKGTVVFLFQPAEEGPPIGEEGGAPLMIKEGALNAPKPTAVFGLHVWPGEPGQLLWRSGPMMAASDRYQIHLKGKQTHGANPWAGIDIASMQAEIVLAFNQIAARQINVTRTPTILTVATVHGGVRYNIIPDEFEMAGTLRTFDPELRKDVQARAEKAVESIAARYGGSGKLEWGTPNPVTNNDPALTAKMKATLSRAAGGKVNDNPDYITGAEDFSYYQRQIPGVFYFLGIGFPKGVNHSPLFNVVDEGAMEVGVRAQALTALDYLASAKK
jgi:amidohydrolase